MRKLLAVVVLAMIVMPAAPAGGGPSVRRSQLAFSAWLVPMDERNHFKWYAAVGWHDSSVAGGRGVWSMAGFMRGHCVRKETRRKVSTRCFGNDFIQGNPNKDFEMDAAADSAVLRIRRGGRTHFVKWTAAPVPDVYAAQEWCGGATDRGFGGGIARTADAHGRFFGHRFESNKALEYAGMWSGVMASRCSGDSHFEFDPRTGTARLSWDVVR
ncbi:MAG: hypothetical protein KY391_06995 [Actinobacteria bacterium]|nr:hypothetical protein [Actinomycetota bacterium]